MPAFSSDTHECAVWASFSFSSCAAQGDSAEVVSYHSSWCVSHERVRLQCRRRQRRRPTALANSLVRFFGMALTLSDIDREGQESMTVCKSQRR